MAKRNLNTSKKAMAQWDTESDSTLDLGSLIKAASLANKNKLGASSKKKAKGSKGKFTKPVISAKPAKPAKPITIQVDDLVEVEALINEALKSKNKLADTTLQDLEDKLEDKKGERANECRNKLKKLKINNRINKGRQFLGALALTGAIKTQLALDKGRGWVGKARKFAGERIDQAKGEVRAITAQGKDVQVAKGFKGLATKVTTSMQDSMKWIGKKMWALGSSILGFLKRRVSAPGIGNLLGLAALVPQLLIPLFKGLNSELEKRFGDDYIKSFIKSLWTSTWSWLVEQIKSVLGLGGYTPDQVAGARAGNATSADAVKTDREAKANLLAATQGGKNLQSESAQENSKILQAKLDFYLGAKDNRKKTQALTNLQNSINDSPANSITPEVAKALSEDRVTKEGRKEHKFVVPANKIAGSTYEGTASSLDGSTSRGAGPAPLKITQESTPSIATASKPTVKPRVSVSPTVSSNPSMETPTTVVPLPQEKGGDKQGTTTSSRSVGSNGIGLASVPTFATGDGLVYHAVMGLA
jgi:hypothetical protein